MMLTVCCGTTQQLRQRRAGHMSVQLIKAPAARGLFFMILHLLQWRATKSRSPLRLPNLGGCIRIHTHSWTRPMRQSKGPWQPPTASLGYAILLRLCLRWLLLDCSTHTHTTPCLQVTASDVVGIGITNQRETTVAWRASSGKPLHNALVWLSTCSEAVNAEVVKELGGDSDALRHVTGLPISAYFSAGKMTWLLQNSEVMPPVCPLGCNDGADWTSQPSGCCCSSS